MVILHLRALERAIQTTVVSKTNLKVHNVATQPSSVFLIMIPYYNKITFEKEPIIARLDFSPQIGVLIIEEWTPCLLRPWSRLTFALVLRAQTVQLPVV